MNRFEYFKGLEPDKDVGEIDKFIKDWHDMADGTYNDKTKMLITFLVYLSEERLPLCPFIGCDNCDRKVKVLTYKFCTENKDAFFVGRSPYDNTCFLHNCSREQYDTKEKAIAAWKKAVGKNE